MPEEIKCPECGSINIEKILDKAAVGPRGSSWGLPEEAEYRKYKCLDCGLAFFESDRRE